MADVILEKDGRKYRFPADKAAAAKAAGFSSTTSVAESALTGAQSAVSLGKDDDLAGAAAQLGTAVQQDIDKGDYGSALRRVIGTVGPLFAPQLAPMAMVESALAERAAPGVAKEAATERRAEVQEAQAANPKAFLGGQLAGALATGGAATAPAKAGAALRSGSSVGLSAPVAALSTSVAPGAAARFAAAAPIGAVTAANMTDSENPIENAAMGVVGGLTAGAGGAALPAVTGALATEVSTARRAAGEAAASRATEGAAPSKSLGDSLRSLVSSYDGAPDLAKAAINAKTGGIVGLLAGAGRTLLGKGKASQKEAVQATKSLIDEVDDMLKAGSWEAPTTSSSRTAPAPSMAAPAAAVEQPAVTFSTGRPQGGSYTVPAEAPPMTPAPQPVAPVAPPIAAPIAEAPAAAATVRPRRLSDDEATALVRDVALREGTRDLATIASKAGISSSQAQRALEKLSKNFRFRTEVDAAAAAKTPAVEMPTSAPARVPAADLLEGVAAQNAGGKVTPTTLRQEAAIVRGQQQAVTIGDFANKMRALPSDQRGTFLRVIKKERGLDFAKKVAKEVGMSTKGIG